jgi:hypothetical protein
MQYPKFLSFIIITMVLTMMVCLNEVQTVDALTTYPAVYIYGNGNGTSTGWINPDFAWNNDTANGASVSWTASGYCANYTMNLTSSCRGNLVNYFVKRSATTITTMQIAVANQTGVWLSLFSGTPTYGSYANATLSSTNTYTAIRFRATGSGTAAKVFSVNETRAVNASYNVPNATSVINYENINNFNSPITTRGITINPTEVFRLFNTNIQNKSLTQISTAVINTFSGFINNKSLTTVQSNSLNLLDSNFKNSSFTVNKSEMTSLYSTNSKNMSINILKNDLLTTFVSNLQTKTLSITQFNLISTYLSLGTNKSINIQMLEIINFFESQDTTKFLTVTFHDGLNNIINSLELTKSINIDFLSGFSLFTGISVEKKFNILFNELLSLKSMFTGEYVPGNNPTVTPTPNQTPNNVSNNYPYLILVTGSILALITLFIVIKRRDRNV